MISIGDKLWALVGLGTNGLSLLLHVIAFALPEWTVERSDTAILRLGLWQVCMRIYGVENCASIKPKDLQLVIDANAFRGVQAFACIALILLVVGVAVSVLRIITSDANQKKLFAMVLIAVHGVASFSLMIAFAVWSGELGKGVIFGASFALEIVCFLLEIAAAVFMFIDMRGTQQE